MRLEVEQEGRSTEVNPGVLVLADVLDAKEDLNQLDGDKTK